MALVQGAFTQLLSPGLKQSFLSAYHQAAMKHSIMKPGTADNDIGKKDPYIK